MKCCTPTRMRSSASLLDDRGMTILGWTLPGNLADLALVLTLWLSQSFISTRLSLASQFEIVTHSQLAPHRPFLTSSRPRCSLPSTVRLRNSQSWQRLFLVDQRGSCRPKSRSYSARKLIQTVPNSGRGTLLRPH